MCGAICSGFEMAALGAVKEADDKLNLFEACKNGDLERVASLLTPESVNSRDVAGRKSTPIHFAAGEREEIAVLEVFFVVWCLHCVYSKDSELG